MSAYPRQLAPSQPSLPISLAGVWSGSFTVTGAPNPGLELFCHMKFSADGTWSGSDTGLAGIEFIPGTTQWGTAWTGVYSQTGPNTYVARSVNLLTSIVAVLPATPLTRLRIVRTITLSADHNTFTETVEAIGFAPNDFLCSGAPVTPVIAATGTSRRFG